MCHRHCMCTHKAKYTLLKVVRIFVNQLQPPLHSVFHGPVKVGHDALLHKISPCQFIYSVHTYTVPVHVHNHCTVHVDVSLNL